MHEQMLLLFLFFPSRKNIFQAIFFTSIDFFPSKSALALNYAFNY